MVIKWISIILTALIVVVGSIFFLEDRYEKSADARTLIEQVKSEMTKNTLNTFKGVQESFKSMQRENNQTRLETLRNQRYLFGQELKSQPNNELLKQRIKILDKEINVLENKLYN